MIVLGADIGGTSMRVALFDHGTERGRADGRGEPIRTGRGGPLAAQLAALTRPLLSRAGVVRADTIVIGAAGAGGDAERHELERAVERERLAWRVLVVTDAALARAAAFEGGPGVLLIAGTGSIAVAVDATGQQRRIGGLGWRMGDEGSAYWIGHAALRAVGRVCDGAGPATRLAERLPPAAGVTGIAALVRWSTTASVADIAALAPVVTTAADQGDAVAQSIITRAVTALIDMVVRAGTGQLPVALSGGLLGPGRPLRTTVTHGLTSAGFTVREGPIDPCRGAIVLAAA